jgi:hypothetical protein
MQVYSVAFRRYAVSNLGQNTSYLETTVQLYILGCTVSEKHTAYIVRTEE